MAKEIKLAKSVGEKIKERRIELGYTQKDVFIAIESDKSTYSLFENGKGNPTVGYISKVAEFLEINIDFIVK